MRNSIARPAIDLPPSNAYREYVCMYVRTYMCRRMKQVAVFVNNDFRHFNVWLESVSSYNCYYPFAVLAPVTATAKLKMNVKIDGDLSMPQVCG